MGKVLVLLYHRVRDYTDDPQLLSVKVDNFSEQINWLTMNYNVVSFDADWNNIDGDAVCITFDDGYKDNILYAAPILEGNNASATIFVSTGNVDTDRELWWDELERNLLIPRNCPKEFVLEDDLFYYHFATRDKEQRLETYKSLHWLMKDFVAVDKRDKWLGVLRAWNGISENGREENVLCSSKELKTVNNEIIHIGAHTVNHPRLSILNKEEQFEEISKSKEKLEQLLGYEVTTFSYPFGGKMDYTTESVNICKQLDFKRVAANYPGVWTAGMDNYQVPRNIIRDWPIETFKNKIKEFWEA